MTDEHLDDGVVLLVLGEGEPSERARMAVHVARCAECRQEYDALVEAVGQVLTAGPAVHPPLGFDSRVVARMAPEARSRRPRRWMWLAAAAAMLAVVVPVAAWAVAGGDAESTTDGSVAALRLAPGGSPVGTVSIADVGGRAVMVVALVDAPEAVSYFCRTRFADGTTFDSDAWPSGNGAWVVPLPDTGGGPVVAVEVLPDGSDHVWSTATFG